MTRRKKIRSIKEGVKKPSKLDVKEDILPAKKKNGILSFLTTGFDIRAVLQIIAIVVAGIALYFALRNFNLKEESEKSDLSLQMGIQPTNQVDSSNKHYYYESWYMIINNGRATVKSVNISWLLNTKYTEYNSIPYLIGSDHGVTIRPITTSSSDFREINIQNCPPGVGFFIGIRHRIKKQYADYIYRTWSEKMFDSDFTNMFLSVLKASGEKVTIKNNGAYDLQSLPNQ